jgi:hypothetical protein
MFPKWREFTHLLACTLGAEDAEILMLRHRLAVAERERPGVRTRLA